MRNDRERLLDILEAIERIDRHAPRTRSAFDRDELVQTWVVHHLEILGEAVRSLSEELRASHLEVAWASIIGMRNILAHQYFGIDLEAVWVVIERDLPTLRVQIQAMLAHPELGGR